LSLGTDARVASLTKKVVDAPSSEDVLGKPVGAVARQRVALRRR
jgi:hypothetical protein